MDIASTDSAVQPAPDGDRGSHCPYCGSVMSEGTCPRCGRICPTCGTPSKEPACPGCGLGAPVQGFTESSSPAPAQSPEFSGVKQMLGRPPSRREYDMFRGLMIDRDKERTHRLTELLCGRLATPLSRELVEMRALQVRSRARKGGEELTNAESVIYSFLEAAKQSGVLDSATIALAEAQLLDSNLRLGLSKARLPPLEFMVEVSGEGEESEPSLLVDGEPRDCKRALMERRAHSRTYLMLWRPFLSDCLEYNLESKGGRRVSACLESPSGRVGLLIAPKDRAADKGWHVDVRLDMRRFFYGFTTRKGVEVDAGVPGSYTLDSTELALRRLAKQLDSLRTTTLLFGMVGAGSPSVALWPRARSIVTESRNAVLSVTPRRKAAASIVAADMRRFAELEPVKKANLVFSAQTVPMSPRDAEYACASGLIVPSEFTPLVGMEWKDILSLAVIM